MQVPRHQFEFDIFKEYKKKPTACKRSKKNVSANFMALNWLKGIEVSNKNIRKKVPEVFSTVFTVNFRQVF